MVALDLWAFRTRLVTRRVFWTAYAIIVFFQLLTNGVLTGLRIVRYNDNAIIGSSTPGTFGNPTDAPPPFFGDGRIAYAPIEDLLFGFTLVTLTLVLWMWLGRRGVQRDPQSGPPMFPRRHPPSR